MPPVQSSGGVARQTLDLRVLNCGGMWDLMSEQEASFLMSALGIFRNVPDPGRSKPRASVSMCRIYGSKAFYREAFEPAHILHICGHGSPTDLQVGDPKASNVTPDGLAGARKRAVRDLPEIIVTTACKLQSSGWQAAMRSAGASVLIASNSEPTPAALIAFDMAFYSALLAQVRKGTSLMRRVEDSFALAAKHYEAIHAAGTPHAKFTLTKL